MHGAVLMPTRKNSQRIPAESPDSPAKKGKEKVKYDSPVSLTEAFKKKLDRVADDLGFYPGALVESQMKQFVEQEWLRLVDEDNREAERLKSAEK